MPATCTGATSIFSTNAILNGSLSGMNPGDQYLFKFGTVSGGPYPLSPTSPAGPQPAADGPISINTGTQLTPGTAYFYVIEVYDSSNLLIDTSAPECTFTTVGVQIDCNFPSPGTNVGAHSYEHIFTAQGNTNPNWHYEIKWGTTPGGPYPNPGTSNIFADGTDPDGQQQVELNVYPANTQIYWVVQMYDDTGGAGSPSNVLVATSSECTFNTTVDYTVACDPASAITDVSANLNGTITNEPSTPPFRFSYGTTPGGPYLTSTALQPGPGAGAQPVTQALSGLTPSTTYHYVVQSMVTSTQVEKQSTECSFTTAAVPPPGRTAQCDPATNITFNSADLNGTLGNIQPGDQFQIRYGTTLGGPYGTTLGPSPAANGAVTQPAIALAPSTTYHYVVDVLSSGNVILTTSSECTFTTVAAPPGPSAAGTPATGVTTNSANTNGTLTSPPPGGFWEIHLGPSGGPYTTVLCPNTPVSGASPQNVTCPATGLAPGTQYCYLVVLKDAGLNVVATSPTQVCFTTAAAPVRTAVIAPATSVTPNSATLSGTVGGIQPGDTYEFHYGTTPGGPYGTTAGPFPAANGPVSAPIAGLTPSTPYYYILVVKDSGAVVKATSAESNFTTQALPVIVVTDPPTTPTNDCTTLHGTATNVPAGCHYQFSYGDVPGGPYDHTISGSPATSSGASPESWSAQVCGLGPNHTIYYVAQVVCNPAQPPTPGPEVPAPTLDGVYWCGGLHDPNACTFVPDNQSGYFNCNQV